MGHIKSVEYKIELTHNINENMIHIIPNISIDVHLNNGRVVKDILMERGYEFYRRNELTEEEKDELDDLLNATDSSICTPLERLGKEIDDLKIVGTLSHVGGDGEHFTNIDMRVCKKEG
jgi:hypothetical protein